MELAPAGALVLSPQTVSGYTGTNLFPSPSSTGFRARPATGRQPGRPARECRAWEGSLGHLLGGRPTLGWGGSCGPHSTEALREIRPAVQSPAARSAAAGLCPGRLQRFPFSLWCQQGLVSVCPRSLRLSWLRPPGGPLTSSSLPVSGVTPGMPLSLSAVTFPIPQTETEEPPGWR